MVSPSNTTEIPVAYREWQERAKSLLEPLLPLMTEGMAHLAIEGKPSDHGLDADRLEALIRPLLLFCHWEVSTAHSCEASDTDLLERGRDWFRAALLVGTDPKSDQFFGYSTNYRQHSVEMGLLAIALEMSRDWLWSTYDALQRERVLSWLESDVGNGHHWNNHMFFGVFLLEFLSVERGENPSYRAAIDWYFGELDKMYAGDGWYMDGSNQAFDFYNAYAWHYYPLWWVRLYGDKDTDRCERMAERTRSFLEAYPLFFAVSGEHPAFGRSITYRFNATAPISLAYSLGISPIGAAQSRSLCERNLDFFLKGAMGQSQGCLSLGWVDEFTALVESYSCAASPYWAAKGFAPLLLSPSDPFWTDGELDSRADSEDGSSALLGPKLIVRRTNGASEIINAGTQIGASNVRFGVHKWGRLSYKTGWGFTVPKGDCLYPFDGSLTAQLVGAASVHGRHGTVPLLVERDRMACLYSLGGKPDGLQVTVETRMWWKGDWQLILHRCVSSHAVTLRQGSYALSYQNGVPVHLENRSGEIRAAAGGRSVALQALAGFQSIEVDERRAVGDGERRCIQADCHTTGLLVRQAEPKEAVSLCCLNYAGVDSEASASWNVVLQGAGRWQFAHASLGCWEILDTALPAL